MPESKTYTIDEIREAWGKYKDAHGFRVLKDGKWKLYHKSPDLSGGATRCEMVKLKNHMSFPKYLEVL